MKIAIDIGHNCPPHDTGASKFKNECEMNKAIGEHLIALLVKAGVDVIDCRPGKAESLRVSLWKRTSIANMQGADFYVSIHHNAGGGEGSEVFAVSDAGRSVAKAVLNRIVSLGFKNRGVKYANFSVLTNSFMPAILIECCFVDRKSDCDLWDSLGSKSIAEAIFNGLQESLKF
jgi:N-acetylmuramoyl-L-alanine amidase